MTHPHVTDWEAKRAFMRDAGAISAAWHPDGTLQALTLGPEQPPPKTDQSKPATEPARRSPVDAYKAAVRGALTGKPVPREEAK